MATLHAQIKTRQGKRCELSFHREFKDFSEFDECSFHREFKEFSGFDPK